MGKSRLEEFTITFNSAPSEERSLNCKVMEDNPLGLTVYVRLETQPINGMGSHIDATEHQLIFFNAELRQMFLNHLQGNYFSNIRNILTALTRHLNAPCPRRVWNFFVAHAAFLARHPEQQVVINTTRRHRNSMFGQHVNIQTYLEGTPNTSLRRS